MGTVDRFFDKVFFAPNGCWLWKGGGTQAGYGQIWDGESIQLAHRWSYQKFIGDIGPLDAHHSCGVKPCVNPDHIRPMSRLDHMRLEGSDTIKSSHCIHGHPFSGDNLRIYKRKNGHVNRICMTCKKESDRRRYL